MSLLSLLQSSPPAVRRPTLSLSFGSDDADKWANALLSLSVVSTLAPAVDSAELRLADNAAAPSVSVGDSGSISLGYADSDNELVMTAVVDALRRSLSGVTRIVVTNGGADLARLRVNQSYDQSSASDVVNDLAGRANADTGKVEDGLALPFFAIDDRQGAYAHIARLAKLSGYIAFFDANGALNFQPAPLGDPVATFNYGQDILALQAPDTRPLVGTLNAIGDGAAGSQGSDAWSWFAKDASGVSGSSGSDDPARTLIDGALRSQSAISGAAAGALASADLVRQTGVLLVPGTPAVLAGATIEIDGAPNSDLNGSCLVRAVRHHYDKFAGFTSSIWFAKSGAGGLGGLGAALGGLL